MRPTRSIRSIRPVRSIRSIRPMSSTRPMSSLRPPGSGHLGTWALGHLGTWALGHPAPGTRAPGTQHPAPGTALQEQMMLSWSEIFHWKTSHENRTFFSHENR